MLLTVLRIARQNCTGHLANQLAMPPDWHTPGTGRQKVVTTSTKWWGDGEIFTVQLFLPYGTSLLHRIPESIEFDYAQVKALLHFGFFSDELPAHPEQRR